MGGDREVEFIELLDDMVVFMDDRVVGVIEYVRFCLKGGGLYVILKFG